MAAAARQLYPRETWEEDVWEEFCSFLGANPAVGLSPPMFSAFRERMEEVEAAERKEFERCVTNDIFLLVPSRHDAYLAFMSSVLVTRSFRLHSF